MFRKEQKAAGHQGCKIHGLRATAVKKLFEARCTIKEAMAITGHKTVAQLLQYAEDVDNTLLAWSAMDKVVAAENKASARGTIEQLKRQDNDET
jgi:hypothetical protein